MVVMSGQPTKTRWDCVYSMIKELTNRSQLMTPFDRCMFALLFVITLCWSVTCVYNLACWMTGQSFRADHILAGVLSVGAFGFKCRIVLGRNCGEFRENNNMEREGQRVRRNI